MHFITFSFITFRLIILILVFQQQKNIGSHQKEGMERTTESWNNWNGIVGGVHNWIALKMEKWATTD